MKFLIGHKALVSLCTTLPNSIVCIFGYVSFVFVFDICGPPIIIQGDPKPLRQTLSVDRANNKEHFLLNNLCHLTRGFKANTGALL